MLSLIFNAQFLESRNFTAAWRCETLLASPLTGILGFFHVFHYRPSRVWILEYVVTGNGSGCDLFSHKFHKTCLEVVELCQPTAKELWKLLVFILVVLGQAVITLGVRLSTSALRRCHCPPALAGASTRALRARSAARFFTGLLRGPSSSLSDASLPMPMLAATAPLFAKAAVPSPEDAAPNVWDSE